MLRTDGFVSFKLADHSEPLADEPVTIERDNTPWLRQSGRVSLAQLKVGGSLSVSVCASGWRGSV